MDSNTTKIIVVGETGNGKSTLYNYILNEKKCKEQIFLNHAHLM